MIEISQRSLDKSQPFFVSLTINAIFSLVIFASIKLLTFQVFDGFWSNWVLFVSILAAAFIVWRNTDPFKNDWQAVGWITQSIGVSLFIILAFTIGF